MPSTATSSRIRRGLIHAATALVAVRIWSLLLFKVHLDRPGVVAAWLAAAMALSLVAVALARNTSEERRSLLQRRLAAIEGPDFAFVALLFVLLFLFHWGFERAASDGREYFVQVRSMVLDRDLDFANENALFGVRGTAGRYPFGAPVLWIPFFVLGHLTVLVGNLLGGDVVASGLSNPYQRAVGLGSLTYGFVALVLIYRLAAGYFGRALAATATIGVAGGSFVLWYLVVDNSMSHAASMFAVTLFVWVWHRGRGDDSARRWAMMGAAAGLMTMVRWQNVLFVAFAVVEEMPRVLGAGAQAGAGATGGPERRGLARLAEGAHRYALCIGAFLVAFSPQLVFWKVVRGEWIAPVAVDHHVAWTNPLVGNVLFSSDRGLFSWTPLLLLAVLGLPLLWRRDRLLAGVSVLAFAGQVYVNSLVEQGGHGFGARKFAGCAVIFALGLAALLDWMRRRPGLAVGLTVGAFVLLNTMFMLDINRNRLPPTGTITFDEMLGAVTSKTANPFSLPMSALLAWRYGADIGMYERLGKQTFNNLSIDFGADDDGRFLARGWGNREADAVIDYRWSIGPESSLVVPLKASADYRLELRAAALPHPDDTPQVLEVRVNGGVAERLALRAPMESYRVSIPAALLDAGYNEIVFRYGYVATPRELGIALDDRPLAVRFDSLSLVRLN